MSVLNNWRIDSRPDGSKFQFSQLRCPDDTHRCPHLDYVMDSSRHFRGDAPHDRVSADIDTASAKSYDALRAEHLADFSSLFDRVSIDLGASTDEQRAQPTNLRKVAAEYKMRSRV